MARKTKKKMNVKMTTKKSGKAMMAQKGCK